MAGKSTWMLLFLPMLLGAQPLAPTTQTHEEQVVRKTYAALAVLCTPPPSPVFEISQVKAGPIKDIERQRWDTRFTIPDDGVVLAGKWKQYDTGDGKPRLEMQVHWGVDHSYTSEEVNHLRSTTIRKVIATTSKDWTVPATYTRYATFQVTLKYQDREVGPYTASFFFGKDANGNEVVAPLDIVVSGQLLWYAIKEVH